MPTLNWIGRKAVEAHADAVPFHQLNEATSLSFGDKGTGNLIVEGDNLLSLKALLPYYSQRIKCIYIDPPYNTGMDDRGKDGKRTGWIYNDNVNSPEIKKWLGKVVGEEAEDLTRHDKWLCMMYPRLALLRNFLREDGVIFVSIDDNELGNLRALLDEIFGISNRVGTIIWKNATDNNPTNIASEHEYVLCYAKNKRNIPREWKSATLEVKQKLLDIGNQFIKDFKNPDKRQAVYSKWLSENKPYLWPFQDYKFIDDGGIYTGMRAVHNPGKEGYRYDVLHPETGKPCAQPMMGYRFPETTMMKLVDAGKIIFGKDETKIVELKVYASEYRAKLSSMFELDGRVGTNEIKDIFPENKRPFDFPKPTALIEELLSFTTSDDDIILDSFAGSGTTGQAVMKLNKMDGGDRRFILAEMKEDIAKSVTSERIRRVSKGYENAKKQSVEGLGGGFSYVKLAEPLFDNEGKIAPNVKYVELARHVFFMETGNPLPEAVKRDTPLIGNYNGTAIYLLFNGILKDKSVDGGNVLTTKILDILEDQKHPKVIYGTACRLGSQRLRRENITFKQLPYDLKVGIL